MAYSIAIDGPAGAGKSTIAKNIAKKLGFIYVDTGAMYRALGVFFLEKKIDITNPDLVSQACSQISIRLEYLNNVQQVILNEINITDKLRTEEVGLAASGVAIYPQVRAKLVEIQQQIAATTNVVMDGRDIGTHVLVNATLKVFLTASVETRANRRWLELTEKGGTPNLESIKSDISSRDYQDMNREASPLRQADDAILVDSSQMDIDQVTERIISLFEQRR